MTVAIRDEARPIDPDLIEDEGDAVPGAFSPEDLVRKTTELISNNKHILVYQAVGPLKNKVFTTSQVQAKDWDMIYSRKKYKEGHKRGQRVYYRKHELDGLFPGWTLQTFEPFYYCPVPSCSKAYPKFTADDGASGLLRLQGHMEIKHRREYATVYQKTVQAEIDKVIELEPNFLTTPKS